MTDFSPSQALTDELAVALQEAKRLTYAEAADLARPIVRYLQQQYGGDELYIPQPYVRRDADEIRAARANGMQLSEILLRYNISRRTYYRLLSQRG